MFWPFRFALSLVWRLKLIVFAAAAGFGAGLFMIVRKEQRTWGVVPSDVDRALVGDDLIAVPDVVETRSLSIAAAPDAVWPWLAQMGYGRGGWYSYDQMDMDRPSATTVLDEFQELAEGDLVPTHPGGGFIARVVQPGEALVLYLDSELVNGEPESSADAPAEEEPAGLQMAGAMGDLTMPEFRATWTFVLVPVDGGTRLIERMRMWVGEAGPPRQLSGPLMGLGVFVMTRKHMLGVKERAERIADER